MNEVVLNVDGYSFIYDGSVKVTYPDQKTIDLKQVQPISIGIMKNNIYWNAHIITRASILKIKEGITENLEVIGFDFLEYMDAILVHNFLVAHLLNENKKEA